MLSNGQNDVPKPKNDVEVPPAVSSLGYLLEEEELYRQGLWKKGQGKTGERTRWLNSPNVYQKVEVLETGTNDPKKITKWVDANNEEIKENRRADKISAGPQSHILEGVTWDEASKLVGEDAANTHTGDHVVLMGAASKGIIQRGYQHNATMYSAPYARNPFDHISDREIEEYRRIVERKARSDYDTDLSESEAISAAQITSPASAPSETEEESRDEHRVLRIETKQAPVRSQPEVVLSDDTVDFLNMERAHADRTKDVDTPRDPNLLPDEEVFLSSPATSPVPDSIRSQTIRAGEDSNLSDEVFAVTAAPATRQPVVVRAQTNVIRQSVVMRGEHTVNGDHSDAHQSTFSHSSKEGSPSKEVSTEDSPKKDKKKKKGLRTPSFLKKKKEKKKEKSSTPQPA
ncbi:hypothetical protein evm_012931 [Chilo suppressalis]|nr:hypothetical protein evm_012931 [Chilo suppressalis]